MDMERGMVATGGRARTRRLIRRAGRRPNAPALAPPPQVASEATDARMRTQKRGSSSLCRLPSWPSPVSPATPLCRASRGLAEGPDLESVDAIPDVHRDIDRFDRFRIVQVVE